MITCLAVNRDPLRAIVLILRVLDTVGAPAFLSLAPLTLARVLHEAEVTLEVV